MKFRYLSPDTTPAAKQAQIAVLNRMTSAQKMHVFYAMCDQVRQIIKAGVRQRHPEYSEQQIHLAMLKHTLGAQLFKKAYPDVEIEF